MSSRLLKTIHETAKGIYDAGVMDLKTMREFDALCLPPVKEYSSNQIKKIRQRTKASQSVFAAYLNTNVSTIQKWEQGQKKPNGISLKILNVIDKKGLSFLEE